MLIMDIFLGVYFIYYFIISSIIFVNVKAARKDGIHAAIKAIPMTLVMIVVATILFIALTNLLGNNPLRRHAPINTYYLSNLTDQQVDTCNIRNALSLMNAEGMFSNFRVHNHSTHPRLQYQYTMAWRLSDLDYTLLGFPQYLSISVNIYSDRERTTSYIQRTRIPPNHDGRMVINNNATSYWLRRPTMPTSASNLYFSSDNRNFRSEIQVGNAVIILFESRRWYKLQSNFSNDFLVAFIEAL